MPEYGDGPHPAAPAHPSRLPSSHTRSEHHGAYDHEFAWQNVTAAARLSLQFRLSWSCDTERLAAEVSVLHRRYGPERSQNGPHHDGGWKAISLVAPRDDWQENRLLDRRCLNMEALKHAPYTARMLDSFDCRKLRARLLSLEPGSRIHWHYDRAYSPDMGFLRVHIPIVTNRDVCLQGSHKAADWRPGEIWTADFSFPHCAVNASRQRRIHLVCDMAMNAELAALLPAHHAQQIDTRCAYGHFSQNLLDLYRGRTTRRNAGAAGVYRCTPATASERTNHSNRKARSSCRL